MAKSKISFFSLFDQSTLKHLRYPFSFFLLPVFLFALSQAAVINWKTAISGFIILHFFLFPSSNGYNSYQDRDETSIGGLKYPPRVTNNLYFVTLLFDMVAVISGLFISVYFSAFVIIFIIMSRLYSYRKIRLKKYPVIGFLTVFLFQGAFVFMMSTAAINRFTFSGFFSSGNILCMLISSLFIGSIYPLTQIYQHEADKNDGVISISYKLGYTGTFLFSAILFVMATFLFSFYLNEKNETYSLVLFFLIILPVVIFLSRWFQQVKKNRVFASYENTMRINFLSSFCMNLYFIILVFKNHF